MRGRGAGQLRLIAGRRGFDVAADVTRGEAAAAQTADRQMREILADPAAMLHDDAYRSRDVGHARVVGELRVDAPDEVGGRGQDGPAGRKRLRGIRGQVWGVGNQRRLQPELTRIESRRAGISVQRLRHGLPTRRCLNVGWRGGIDADVTFHGHRQEIVRFVDREIGDPVSEEVLPVVASCGSRLDLKVVGFALLARRGPRQQMGFVLALRDRRGVAVLGRVRHAVARHASAVCGASGVGEGGNRAWPNCRCTSTWLK